MSDGRQALADRRVIERAKGILMKKGQLDEQEAFRRLQKLDRDQNMKLAEEALQPAGAQGGRALSGSLSG